MKVVHIAFECAPIYKTGGLGDVVGSLPKVLEKLGIETYVVMPGYAWIKRQHFLPGSKVPVIYVDGQWFSKLNSKHERKTQATAYAHFCLEVLEELKRRNLKPDILHCHDWHAGIIPWLLKHQPDGFFAKTKTLLTIHNVSYQGNFDLRYLDDPQLKSIVDRIPAQTKRISFLKLGIDSANYVSTVSPNHAREIRKGQVGFGLSRVIRKKRGRFIGIINGIDDTTWNPDIDRFIKYHFDTKNVNTQKAKNKRWLEKKLGLLQNDEPLVGMVARISSQKGFDLVLQFLARLSQLALKLVILGTGDEFMTRELSSSSRLLPDRLAFAHTFDEAVARQIYAASDFFLIPSVFEPCGLTQIISMRYGTIPIGAHVGGLVDTIQDGVTGFLFHKHETKDLLGAIERSLKVYHDPSALQVMRLKAMRRDFSWTASAKKYVRLYKKMTG